MATSDKIMLTNARLSFPVLFEPRAFQPGQTPKFESTFLLDPSDKTHAKLIKKIDSAASALIKEKWPKGAPKGLKRCYGLSADADNKDYEGYEDMFYLSSSEATRPHVVNRDRSPITKEDGIVYPGCYVNGSISLWAQDNQFGKRINANLRAVQFVRDGEPLGGGGAPVNVDEEFEEIEDDEEDYLD